MNRELEIVRAESVQQFFQILDLISLMKRCLCGRNQRYHSFFDLSLEGNYFGAVNTIKIFFKVQNLEENFLLRRDSENFSHHYVPAQTVFLFAM